MDSKHFIILMTARAPDDLLANRVLAKIRQMVVNANSTLWPRDTVGNEVIYSDYAFLEGTTLSLGDEASTLAELDRIMTDAGKEEKKLICFAYEMGLLDGNEEIGEILRTRIQQKLGTPLQYAEVWFDASAELPEADRVDLQGKIWTRIKYMPVQIFEGVVQEIPQVPQAKPKNWLAS